MVNAWRLTIDRKANSRNPPCSRPMNDQFTTLRRKPFPPFLRRNVERRMEKERKRKEMDEKRDRATRKWQLTCRIFGRTYRSLSEREEYRTRKFLFPSPPFHPFFHSVCKIGPAGSTIRSSSRKPTTPGQDPSHKRGALCST